MDEMNFYNKHYITVDEMGRIVNGFSDAFHDPGETDICINERGGYQFRLFPGGEENPFLLEEHGVPRYKYTDGAVAERTAEEIAADIAALPAPEPAWSDRVDAQLTYTAMMTDTLLEV